MRGALRNGARQSVAQPFDLSNHCFRLRIVLWRSRKALTRKRDYSRISSGGALDAKLTAKGESGVADHVEQPEIGLGVEQPARKLGLGEELAARFAIA